MTFIVGQFTLNIFSRFENGLEELHVCILLSPQKSLNNFQNYNYVHMSSPIWHMWIKCCLYHIKHIVHSTLKARLTTTWSLRVFGLVPCVVYILHDRPPCLLYHRIRLLPVMVSVLLT